MGISLHSATYSTRLEALAKELEKRDPVNAHECFDLTSTAGYDNDGSTGPELVDNGIALGLECRDYSPKAQVFWALVDNGDDGTMCCYQYGLNEDDALSRLEKAAEILG
jgi:hypothetical protein